MASRNSSRNGGFSSSSSTSSSHLTDSVSKKQKNEVTGAEETLDRLSQLPDAVLVQILSLLPTKDAVKSCLLSRRWRYLWHSIYNFLFDNFYYKEPESFKSFVDHVLTHSTCSKIKNFQLDLMCFFGWVLHLKISQWLNFAVERKVENLVFYSPVDLNSVLPLSIYSCSSLITLELSHWVFDKGLVIAWNSLKSLKLDTIELDDDGIVNLLSGCPALETLELSCFQGFRRLEITSPNLKRLILDGGGGFDSLEIVAPHLQHLEISGDRGYLKHRLVNVSSLVTASLTFSIICITGDVGTFIGEEEEEDDVEEDNCPDSHQAFRNLVLDYLEKLSHVTQLKIGSWLAEVVFMLQLEGVPLPELRCKCLTLEMLITESTLYGVASLLRTSPFLETLNIHLGVGFADYYHCELERSYFAKGDNINLRSWISNIVFPNLKTVKIDGCIDECLKEWSKAGELFVLSEFLLKNAVALKKFVIVAKRGICELCDESCVPQYLSRLVKNLLDSQRSSMTFVIIYQDSAQDD